MEKIFWNSTYGYKDFISEDERLKLIELTNLCEPSYITKDGTKILGSKNFSQNLNDFVKSLKERIVEIEKLVTHPESYKVTLFPEAFISFYGKNGECPTHTDTLFEKHINHVRYNILISKADVGGLTIHGEENLDIEERVLWRCNSSSVVHGSTKVESEKPRGILSIGFML